MEPNNNNNTEGTDRKKLMKGFKFLAGSLILAFSGPTILYSAFGNRDKFLYIPVLIVGSLISIGAIYCIYKGVQTIMRAIFND